ncbi:MAG TPA: hypothetical protein VF749_09395, partial [Candidatus Acidoferrum sp.]
MGEDIGRHTGTIEGPVSAGWTVYGNGHADADARLHPQHTSGISAGAPREPSSRERSGSRSRG